MTAHGADESVSLSGFYAFVSRVAQALGPGWIAEHSNQDLRRSVLHGPGGQCLNLAPW